MEYWESKTDDDLILKLIRNILIKIDPSPLNPAFHHSSIPSFRSRLQQIRGIADWL
ncbi:hypothetical protein D1AOALGA4SA_84 [Olavius algarvensis Delta 1 endosymbiont]|nr:hypothetical protein D1AOALGA4SA_84 [Olavius algarvensis Delta 1 endosymbiont]